MAKIAVPYFVERGRANKAAYYWQPNKALRALGWQHRRLSDDREAALEEARQINRTLAKWRTDRMAAPPAEEQKPVRLPVGQAEPGTVDELIRAYKKSDHFTRLRPKTQRGYRQCLERLAAEIGHRQRHAIVPADAQDLYKKIAKDTPSFARAIVRVGRLLWSAGRLIRDLGITGDNPFVKMKISAGAQSGLIWPRAAIDWIVAVADAMGRPSIGTAVLVNSWIGQREGDVLRMGRGVLAPGGRAMRQAKTGSVARLPMNLIPQVADRIRTQIAHNEEIERAQAEQRDPARKAEPVVVSTLLIDEHTGRPWHEDTFRHVFAAVRAEAARLLEGQSFDIDWLRPSRRADDPKAYELAMTDLQFMHLRHTAVVYLAEAGVDLLGISSITGHTPKSCQQILDRYGIKTGRLAGEAFKRRLAHEADHNP